MAVDVALCRRQWQAVVKRVFAIELELERLSSSAVSV